MPKPVSWKLVHNFLSNINVVNEQLSKAENITFFSGESIETTEVLTVYM